MPRTRIYDQARLCGDNNCCPVVEKDESGQIAISDPTFPNQGRFTFKNEEEARTFFENAPARFAAYLASKKA